MPCGLTGRCHTRTRSCCSQSYRTSLDLQHVLRVPLEKTLQLVRTRPATQSHTPVKQGLKQPPLPNSCSESNPGDSVAGPRLRRLWHGTFQNKWRRKRQALHRRLLKHRLLLAVIPWVGDINLSCTQAPRRPAVVQTQGTTQGSLGSKQCKRTMGEWPDGVLWRCRSTKDRSD